MQRTIKGFTLVELIVVITILAILGTIAFISLQGYSKNARDTKRVNDVKSLETKILIENTKGVLMSNLVETKTTTGVTINNSGTTSIIGFVNFENLREDSESFQDPVTKQNYPIAYVINPKGGYFYQIAYMQEGLGGQTKLIGNYYKVNENDSGNLFNGYEFEWGGEIIETNPTEDSGSSSSGGGSESSSGGGSSLPVIDGVCGTANNTDVTSEPNGEEACASGALANMSGTGPWTWSCNGENGGTNVNCSANKQINLANLSAGEILASVEIENGITLIPSNNLGEDIVIKGSGGTGYVIMDRNLGATATGGISCNSSSCRGNHYQWGNNYGFPSTSSPAYTPNSSSQASASGYGPGNYYNSGTFITQNQGWDSANNRNLWGGQGDKESSNGTGTNEDRQGPCPDGYHIPSTWEWKSLSTFGINSALWASNNNNFHNKLFFPLAGYRRWDTAVLDSQTINGYYWSSSPSDTVASSAYFLSISNNSVYSQGNQFRGFGRSIRCFKN